MKRLVVVSVILSFISMAVFSCETLAASLPITSLGRVSATVVNSNNQQLTAQPLSIYIPLPTSGVIDGDGALNIVIDAIGDVNSVKAFNIPKRINLNGPFKSRLVADPSFDDGTISKSIYNTDQTYRVSVVVKGISNSTSPGNYYGSFDVNVGN